MLSTSRIRAQINLIVNAKIVVHVRLIAWAVCGVDRALMRITITSTTPKLKNIHIGLLT